MVDDKKEKALMSALGIVAKHKEELPMPQRTRPTTEEVMYGPMDTDDDYNFNIDTRDLCKVIQHAIYLSNRLIVNDILSKEHGFAQTDGTYAIYKSSHEALRKAYSGNQIPGVLQGLYNDQSKKLLSIIFSNTLSK